MIDTTHSETIRIQAAKGSKWTHTARNARPRHQQSRPAISGHRLSYDFLRASCATLYSGISTRCPFQRIAAKKASSTAAMVHCEARILNIHSRPPETLSITKAKTRCQNAPLRHWLHMTERFGHSGIYMIRLNARFSRHHQIADSRGVSSRSKDARCNVTSLSTFSRWLLIN